MGLTGGGITIIIIAVILIFVTISLFVWFNYLKDSAFIREWKNKNNGYEQLL